MVSSVVRGITGDEGQHEGANSVRVNYDPAKVIDDLDRPDFDFSSVVQSPQTFLPIFELVGCLAHYLRSNITELSTHCKRKRKHLSCCFRQIMASQPIAHLPW